MDESIKKIKDKNGGKIPYTEEYLEKLIEKKEIKIYL